MGRCDLSMCGGLPGEITHLIKWVQHLMRLSSSAGWIRVGQPSSQGASGEADFLLKHHINIPDSARLDPAKQLLSVTKTSSWYDVDVV